MSIERDIQLPDGRMLSAHDTGARAGEAPAPLTIMWHHGSPQTGALLDPLLRAAMERSIRLISYGRPSYGGSTPMPGRDVASAAADAAHVADALQVERFAVMGASGGGPHALACAALLPGRVTAAACLAGIAPPTDDFDWFACMADPGGLQAALHGRPARAAYAETEEFDPACFVAADWAALEHDWSSLGVDAGRASAAGPDGLIDDDVAFANPWGFKLAGIEAPVLFVQGALDRVVPPAHARWLHGAVAGSELWLRPDDGHVSILDACTDAMDWLLARTAPQPGD